jgi:hypothetical protein
MDETRLEQFLREADDIAPSSGFAERVMDTVLLEASGPPPLAFPWLRAIPGLVALLVALGVSSSAVPAAARQLEGAWLPWTWGVIDLATSGIGPWISLAVCLTILPVLLSMKLARSWF